MLQRIEPGVGPCCSVVSTLRRVRSRPRSRSRKDPAQIQPSLWRSPAHSQPPGPRDARKRQV